MKFLIKISLFLIPFLTASQIEKIKILHADRIYSNQVEHPNTLILSGKIKLKHKGILIFCEKAFLYRLENNLYAYGNVIINQGDSIQQYSNHVQYDGNSKKMLSWGKVLLRDKTIILTTDTLHFDRSTQVLSYHSHARIVNKDNTFTSKVGQYFTKEKKLTAKENVELFNKEMHLKTEHLDYNTDSEKSYLYGPSTLFNEGDTLYTEKGIYDSKHSFGQLLKNSTLYHKNNEIKADSIYYDKTKEFASGTGNLSIIDRKSKQLIKGKYGEFYMKKDSIIIPEDPLIISVVKNDSMYIHGDTLSITGKDEDKSIKVFHRVKIFKKNLSAKCDSLTSHQKNGHTELFKKPILWSENNQITGDRISLLYDKKTKKLDSIKITKNAFLIQKDSAGYNQIKGRDFLGKIKDQELSNLLVKEDGAVVAYARNQEKDEKLMGITKVKCSDIYFSFKNGKIDTIKFLKNPNGKTYPFSEFPKKERLLKGFIWRDKEKILKKEDIFIRDEF